MWDKIKWLFTHITIKFNEKTKELKEVMIKFTKKW